MIDLSDKTRYGKHELLYGVMTLLNRKVKEFGYFIGFLVGDFQIINDPAAPALAWVQRHYDKNVLVINVNEEMFKRYFPAVTTKNDKIAAYALVILHETFHLMAGHLHKKRNYIFPLLDLPHSMANKIMDEVVNEFIKASVPLTSFGASYDFSEHAWDALVTHDKVVAGLRSLEQEIHKIDRKQGELAKELINEYAEFYPTEAIEKRAAIIGKLSDMLKKSLQQQQGGGNNNQQQQGNGNNQQQQGGGGSNGQQQQNGNDGNNQQQQNGSGNNKQQNSDQQGSGSGKNKKDKQQQGSGSGSGKDKQKDQNKDKKKDPAGVYKDIIENILDQMGKELSDHDGKTTEVDDGFQEELDSFRRQTELIVKERSEAYNKFLEHLESINKDAQLSKYLQKLQKGVALMRKKIGSKIANNPYTIPDVPKEVINKRLIELGEEVAWALRRRKEQNIMTAVNIYIDVSGSISQKELEIMLNNFAGVVFYLGAPLKLFVWSSCPDDPQYIGEFDRNNPPQIKEIPTCGGTSITPVINRINENIKEERGYIHVILTDGYTEHEFPMIHPQAAKHTLIGLFGDQKELMKRTGAEFIYTFRLNDSQSI